MSLDRTETAQPLLPLPQLPKLPLLDGQVQVDGIVSSQVFVSPEADFAVLRLDVAGQIRPVVAVGALAGLRIGETVRIIGRYEQHDRYGQRLRADQALPQTPESRLGVERYLSTLAGLGPELARRIVAELGPRALIALEEETFRVAQIKGVGKKRAQRALIDARARREEREVMIFLQGLGISAAYAARIRKQWGQTAITKVRENPYALAREVTGIGFHIADRIAAAMGVEPLSPLRCVAGGRHVLLSACDSGHCYLPTKELLQRAVQLLTQAPPDDHEPNRPLPPPDEKLVDAVEKSIETMRSHGETVHEGDAVYLSSLHQQEVDLTRQVSRLLSTIRARIPTISEHDISLRLAEGQKAALLRVETSPLSIITGGPGTGKTTIISALVRAYLRAGLRVCLTAPTGRAAKRLSDATGQTAKTIHRLLNLIPGERGRVAKDLEIDLLVCDEASMLDLPLALTLLRAVPGGATVVLVGDVDQLPSVGPGRVLADLIDSTCIPVTRLREIFRQKEGSGIIDNAQAILRGELPLSAPSDGKLADFYWIEVDDAQKSRDTVVKLVSERIPQRFGFDPLTDVQVLTPMHRGEVGTEELNRALQAQLNPAAKQPQRPQATTGEPTADKPSTPQKVSFYVGDKVMQVRNNYELDVWNGDIGVIIGRDEEDDLVLVRFEDERQVAYDAEARDDLELAYAVSVHKSQGSEYKAVVVPLHIQHFPLLRRNLVYTAVTRGKKLVVMVGSRRAVRRAVTQTGDLQRYTGLRERLRSMLPSG